MLIIMPALTVEVNLNRTSIKLLDCLEILLIQIRHSPDNKVASNIYHTDTPSFSVN
jgi:hypothetical protein